MKENNKKPLLLLFVLATGCRLLGQGISLLYPTGEIIHNSMGTPDYPGIWVFYFLVGGGLSLYRRFTKQKLPATPWYGFLPFMLPLLSIAFLFKTPMELPDAICNVIYNALYLGLISMFIHILLQFPFKDSGISRLFVHAFVLIIISDLALPFFYYFKITHLTFLIIPPLFTGFFLWTRSIPKGSS